ncbi:MAG: hypothetical protein LBO82_00300, partial [Synergistaceae bacterium]|nr:hypothetical protein [Synergistaceae bacterium]
MLKFMMFPRKSTRKIGLLVLSLLLAAVPRAWGSFTITSADGTNYYYSSEVLIISADGLPPDTVISGEGKGIAVKGSGAKLTLQDLTVNAVSGPAAFWLDGCSADIRIAGTVTLNCNGGDGFLVSLDNDNDAEGIVILDAVPGSTLTASSQSGNFCGMDVKAETLLQGDGEFVFNSESGNGLKSEEMLYIGGSATLSARGGGGATAIVFSNSFFLFENAKINSADGGIHADKNFCALENASVAEGISVVQGEEKTELSYVEIKAEPPGSYGVTCGEFYVKTNPVGWGKGWFSAETIALLSAFQSGGENNGFSVTVIGDDEAGDDEAEVSIDSITPIGSDGNSFLFNLSGEAQEKALSIQYKLPGESESPYCEVFAGERTVSIDIETRNIPSETYAIELHGAPKGVSLSSVRINSNTTDTSYTVVTYETADPSVTYEDINSKDATLTFTLGIPAGLSRGTYPGLSFGMKKDEGTATGYDGQEFAANIMGGVPSTLWLPAFNLVVKDSSGPEPEPVPPEEPVTTYPELPLPPPPETPAG